MAESGQVISDRPATRHSVSEVPILVDPVDTPASQQSATSYFGDQHYSDVWDTSTPGDDDGLFSPYTPPSKLVSGAVSQHEVADTEPRFGREELQVKSEPNDDDDEWGLEAALIKSEPNEHFNPLSEPSKDDQLESKPSTDNDSWLHKIPNTLGVSSSIDPSKEKKDEFKFKVEDFDNNIFYQTPSKQPQSGQSAIMHVKKKSTDATVSVQESSPTEISTLKATSTTETVFVVESHLIDSRDSEKESRAGHVSTLQTETAVQETEQSVSQITKKAPEACVAINLRAFSVDLFKILPLDIKERFTGDSRRCCASTRKSQQTRCKKPARALRGRDGYFESQLRRLSAPESLLSISNALDSAQRLGDAAFCTCHIKVAKKQRGILDEKLRKSGFTDDPKTPILDDVDLHDDFESLNGWIKAITGPSVIIKEERTTQLSESTFRKEEPESESKLVASTTIESTQTTTLLTPTGSAQYSKTVQGSFSRSASPNPILHFQPYIPDTIKKYDADTLLLSKMVEPVEKKDLKKGTIYFYWAVGLFGKIKIGVTQYDIDNRLKEWKNKCKLEIDELRGEANIPHAYRVEKLIQAELKDKRFSYNCNCKSQHREWFEVSKEQASRVLQKWVKWIKTEPYEQVPGKDYWRLKPTIAAKVLAEVGGFPAGNSI